MSTYSPYLWFVDLSGQAVIGFRRRLGRYYQIFRQIDLGSIYWIEPLELLEHLIEVGDRLSTKEGIYVDIEMVLPVLELAQLFSVVRGQLVKSASANTFTDLHHEVHIC